MLYPLKFEPVYKNYIWGGRGFEKLGRSLPEGVVAESWDLSCNPAGISVVSEGELKGISLPDLLRIYKSKLLGTNFSEEYVENFPLLVKLIDANDKLSIQVHPDDEYAMVYEDLGLGKNEMWYILDAKPGAKLVYGLKEGVTKEIFHKGIQEGTLESLLRTIEVSKGDIINIPAGVVHAIGEGIMIVEVQQNSNTTYRVYDYERTDSNGNKRPLHIEQALDVINFTGKGSKNKNHGLEIIISQEFSKTFVVANKFFAAEILKINGTAFEKTDGSKFCIHTVFEGEGEIRFENGITKVRAGDTVLIPASLGNYFFRGNLKILKSYIPNLKQDVVSNLKAAGFSNDNIYSIIS